MRLKLAGAFALIVALLAPAAAQAVVRKVDPTGSDSTNCTFMACKTIQYAANQGDPNDTVEIAAGTYTETVTPPMPVNFIGAGNGATIVRGEDGSSAAGKPAFVLPTGGSITALRAEGGDGDSVVSGPITTTYEGGPAIRFQPLGLGQQQLELNDVTALGGDGGAGGGIPIGGSSGGSALLASAEEGGSAVSIAASSLSTGSSSGLSSASAVVLSGAAMSAKITGSQVVGAGGFFGSGLNVRNGATAILETSLLEGLFGVGVEAATVEVRRSRIEGQIIGVEVTPVSSPKAEAKVIDSVVTSEGTAALATTALGTGQSRLVSRGSTFVTEGGSGPVIESQASTTEQPVTVSLHNTIAVHLNPSGEPLDLRADAATIEADHSNFISTTVSNGGSAPAPGGGTNLGGSPGFAGSESFSLASNSPLIDRGDPAIVESSELDLEGTTRSLDGNRDCIAAPDIGAYEVAGQSAICPPVKVTDAVPVVTGFGISNKTFAPKGKKPAKASKAKKGTKFSYTLSEPAQVAIKIERRKSGKGRPKYVKVTMIGGQQRSGKDATPFSGKVKGKPLNPGKYRATIVATDAAGQTSAPQQLSFQVVSG